MKERAGGLLQIERRGRKKREKDEREVLSLHFDPPCCFLVIQGNAQ